MTNSSELVKISRASSSFAAAPPLNGSPANGGTAPGAGAAGNDGFVDGSMGDLSNMFLPVSIAFSKRLGSCEELERSLTLFSKISIFL